MKVKRLNVEIAQRKLSDLCCGEGGSPLRGEEKFHKEPILPRIEQGLAFYIHFVSTPFGGRAQDFRSGPSSAVKNRGTIATFAR